MRLLRRSLSGYCVLDLDGSGALDIHATLDDARTCADWLAERDAEVAREYSERWQAAVSHNEDRDTARQELRQARQAAAAIVQAWREQRIAGALVPAVCDVLRARYDQARDDMSAALDAIERATDAIAALDMAGEFCP